MDVFGANFKKARKGKGWTQERTAVEVGVKRSLVGAWEEGRSLPSRQVQIQVMKTFGITDWDGFCEKEDFDLNDQPRLQDVPPYLNELQEKYYRADDKTRQVIGILLGFSEGE